MLLSQSDIAQAAIKTKQFFANATRRQHVFLLGEARRIKSASKGQITMAQAVREQAGLHPRSEVAFDVQAHGDVLLRAAPRPAASLRGAFERVRSGANATQLKGMGTDKFMAFSAWMAKAMPEVRESDARYVAQPAITGTLVDLCILIDLRADDPQWCTWFLQLLKRDAARYRRYFPRLALVAP